MFLSLCLNYPMEGKQSETSSGRSCDQQAVLILTHLLPAWFPDDYWLPWLFRCLKAGDDFLPERGFVINCCSRMLHFWGRFVLVFYGPTHGHGTTTGPSESGLHSSVMREPHPTVWTVVEYFQVSSLGERDTVSGSMYLSTTCWLFTTFRLGLCDGGSSLSGWVDLKSPRRHTSEHVCEGFLESCNRMEELPWIN